MDWQGLSVCLLALAVYINTLGHGFVYDDNRAILSNPDIQASSPLVNVFQNDFWGTALSSSNSHGSYRPLCVLSFRLNHWAAGFQPFSYHLTNVLLHSVATLLVLKTARNLLPGKSSMLAAALFAVHPVHVEAVAGVVGRADVLASIFYLISFLSYVKHVKVRDNIFISKVIFERDILIRNKTVSKKSESLKKNENTLFTLWEDCQRFQQVCRLFIRGEKVYFSFFVVFAICAVLCKEPGVIVIPLTVFYDIILHLRSKRAPKLNTCVLASVSASLASFLTILLTRLYLMGLHTPTFSRADNPSANEASVFARTLTFWYLPVFNLYLLIYPRWLSFDWSMDAIPRVYSVLDMRFIVSVIVYFLLYRTTRYALKCNETIKNTVFSKPKNCKVCKNHFTEEHLLSCKVVNNNNLPQQCPCFNTSHRPWTTGSTVTMCLAFTVLPFIPASNLFFYVGFVVAERVLYLPSIGFCLLVALGAHTLFKSRKYLVLFGCVLLLTTLGVRTIQRNRDWSSEESLYRSATDINPPKAYGNLGSILSTAGRLQEAEAALRLALKYRPNMADVHYNLGNLLTRQQKHLEAVSSYKLAIHYRPSLAVAHLNLGQVLEALERLLEAETVYLRCWRLDAAGLKDLRTHEDARSSCLHRLSRLCESVSCQSETVKIVRNTIERTGSLVKNRASEINVDATIQENTTRYSDHPSRNKSRTSDEEDLFLRALQRAPSDPTVYVNYGQLLVQQRRRAEAAAVFVKAAQLAPQQHALVTSAAIALRHAGRLAEAEALYLQARDLRPSDASSHSNLGAIFHLQGKYHQAASCYKEALRLSPSDHVTLTNLQKLRNLLVRSKR